MIATPSSASCRTILNIVSHSDDDSAEVGSSMTRMRVSSDSALAISTSCCSPLAGSAAGVNVDAEAAQQAFCRSDDTASIDQRAGNQRLAAKKDVVGHAQFGDEIELLMNDRYASTLGIAYPAERYRVALHLDDALVARMHAGEDFHQGALAGAVLAHQRMHLAASEVEVDVA